MLINSQMEIYRWIALKQRIPKIARNARNIYGEIVEESTIYGNADKNHTEITLTAV